MSRGRGRVLVVDDKPNILRLVGSILSPEHEVRCFGSAREALAVLAAEQPEVLISDIRMPEMDGLELLRAVREKSPETQVVLITAYAAISQAVEAIKAGAFDYLAKPFEPPELGVVVRRALEHRGLVQENRRLRHELSREYGFEGFVGDSPAMRQVAQGIRRVMDVDTTVLVEGETGTGKELVARALHYSGARAHGPFVVVHCAALPKDLLESELFGHVKGAFSGALASKRGLAEAAEGGTLFLDEVNSLDLDLQAKITRLLQEKEVRPVGATEWKRVDVRIVAATNRDLRKLVEEDRFREDLYYRLAVYAIRLPPLRERREDIPALARHFLAKHASRLGRPVREIAPETLDALAGQDWPGNVRELEHAVEKALILADGPILGPESFPTGATSSPAKRDWRGFLETATAGAARQYLSDLLRRHAGSVSRAAEEAGVERQSFHRLLKRFQVPHEKGGKGENARMG